MLRWLKQKSKTWTQGFLQREIERLQKENAELKADIEEGTGQPVQFTNEEQEQMRNAGGGSSPDD